MAWASLASMEVGIKLLLISMRGLQLAEPAALYVWNLFCELLARAALSCQIN